MNKRTNNSNDTPKDGEDIHLPDFGNHPQQHQCITQAQQHAVCNVNQQLRAVLN